MDVVAVEPLDSGWAVRAGELDNAMVFRSGKAAETAARDLAMRMAAAGRQTELRVTLRSGEIAARFLCLPPLDHETRPLMISMPTRGAPDLPAAAA